MSGALEWDRVLAWRMRRQYLLPRTEVGAVDIVHRLCGVQAHVASAAVLTITVRQARPDLGAFGSARPDAVNKWLSRGTNPAGRVRSWLAGLDGVTEVTVVPEDQLAEEIGGLSARIVPAGGTR